jgi:hypothetical protein
MTRGMNSRPIATRLKRITRTPAFALVLVVMLSLSISVSLSVRRLPQPTAADEFSYLVAADTFAHGRITNPTHPMWVHFESPHLIHEPTYISKFPPGQGLVLAAGQLVFGRPIAGVWLSVALACAALWWMLSAWMPARWALCGGCLAALHPWFIDWSQSYWGGAQSPWPVEHCYSADFGASCERRRLAMRAQWQRAWPYWPTVGHSKVSYLRRSSRRL